MDRGDVYENRRFRRIQSTSVQVLQAFTPASDFAGLEELSGLGRVVLQDPFWVRTIPRVIHHPHGDECCSSLKKARQRSGCPGLFERADGGRGIRAFDGGHFNDNWGNQDFSPVGDQRAALDREDGRSPKDRAKCEDRGQRTLTAHLDPKPAKSSGMMLCSGPRICGKRAGVLACFGDWAFHLGEGEHSTRVGGEYCWIKRYFGHSL